MFPEKLRKRILTKFDKNGKKPIDYAIEFKSLKLLISLIEWGQPLSAITPQLLAGLGNDKKSKEILEYLEMIGRQKRPASNSTMKLYL